MTREGAAAATATGEEPGRAERLAEQSTEALRARLANREVVVLVPVGSLEPHGPHLPLGTDAYISEAVAEAAARELVTRGTDTLVAPTIAYGVTDFAAGFAGAVSIADGTLGALCTRVAQALIAQRFRHVCFVNNHLEPAHDAALRTAIEGLPHGSASVASPLTRRWARLLSEEFKSGACHAGQYETSLMLAIAPALVDTARAVLLPALDISLSQAIQNGVSTFAACGMSEAYTGAPGRASLEHGRLMLGQLVSMVVGEVEQALTTATTRPPPSDYQAR